MKLAYFGTPQFAADLLETIHTNNEIDVQVTLVVTQPDQPVGRKKIITPAPVKVIAQKHNIPFYESLDVPQSALSEVDIAIIYYYGKIIPANFLSLPTYGFWNIHFSKLPQYRGATPATFSLMMGNSKTAVSLVHTDAKLDHGLLISQDETDIDPHETRLELEGKLHNMLAGILVREISQASSFTQRLQEQDHAKATYTLFPTKDHGYIPLSSLKKAINGEVLEAEEIPALIKDYFAKNNMENNLDLNNSGKIMYDYYRGLHTWPGIWTKVGDKRMKITDCSLAESKLVINRVQFEGKTETNFNTQMILSS